MKILQIVGACIAGGAENMATALAIELSKTHDVRIFFLSERTDELGTKLLNKLKIKGITYGFGSPNKVTIPGIIKLCTFINHFSPDIIHFHTPNTEKAFVLCRPFLKKVPALVRTIHNNSGILTLSNRFCYLLNHKAKTVACGPSVSKNPNIAKFFSSITTIENGVLFNWPIQQTKTKTSLRRKLGLNEKSIHFLCVGRMAGDKLEDTAKAHDLLIRAWSHSDAHTTCYLHLLGDGNLRGELEALASNTKNIIFHGVHSNISEWLQASDVFIMPSRYEGLPIAGIEAAGTGLSTIFSNIAPLVQLEYEHSAFFPSGNTEELSHLINKFVYSVPKPDIEAAIKIRKRYGIEKMVTAYLEVYKKFEK